jgi:hypothetical protein
MVRFRGLPRDACAASATAIAVPKQSPRFEIHAPWSLSIFVSTNFDFPINVVQIATSARIVRFWGGLLPRHLNVLSAFQHAAVADAETAIAAAKPPDTLCRGDIISTTKSFDPNPECVVIQLVRPAIEIVSDPIIVGPPNSDG